MRLCFPRRSAKRNPARSGRRPERLETRYVFSSGYLQLSLASDQAAGALVQDPALVGPWGMAASPTGGDLWVVNSISGLATHYSGAAGSTSPSEFQSNTTTIGGLGSQPRGAAFNSGAGFFVQPENPDSSASLIFAAQDGSLSAWNSDVPPPAPSPAAQTKADVSGAEYTGVAVENATGGQFVYAADFHDGRIDVFDGDFNRVTPAGGFTDPNLPAGYAPFNIINTGAALLVAYARQDADRQSAVPTLGGGIIDEFDYAGHFEQTLISGGPANTASRLNAPWGMALAPISFGDFGGDLLVANSGDGKINAFNPATGAYEGTLTNPAGNPLVVSGLHGLLFGNGVAGDTNTLFFTAAGSKGQNGLLGEIVSAQNNLFPAVGSAITSAARDTMSGMLAVFNDVNSAPAGSFLATISWGDGTAAYGTVVALPSGGYGVLGSHSYFTPSQYTVTVAIYDAQSATATVTDTVDVTPPRLIFTTGAVTATEGVQFSGPVATFTDQDDNTLPFWYQASIDWGDGTATTGTITGNSPFTVSGSHAYTHQGNEPITIKVTDNDGSVGTANVAAGIVSSLAGTGFTIQPTEGAPFTMTVASFTDANSGQSSADYSATIHWGDGGTTSGVIAPDGSGGYSVSGVYNYMVVGTESITVTISDPGSTITVAGTALVADGNTLTATAAAISGSQGAAFTGAAATFTDTFPATPDTFTASIDWGDGTVSAGVVSVSAGVFTVSGTHTYLGNGDFNVTTTVHDIGGTASATAQATATMADANVLHATPASVSAVAGQTLTAALATVSDVYKGAVAGQFSARIVWGDGATTSGTVSGGDGQFTVSGSHAYSNSGAQTATVAMTENSPGTASSTATVGIQVADAPPVITVSGISGHAQSAFTGAVATFTDPGSSATSDFTADIRWGDGNSSSGAITGDASGFTVSGTHTYASEGHYTLAVIIVRDGGGSTTATGLATILGPRLADGTYGTPETRWVNDVYGDLLHRPADAGALAYWAAQLANGAPRQLVVNDIESSVEYRGDEIQSVYQAYLHRAAEPAAVTYYTQFLANHSPEQLSAIIIGSAEYYTVRGGGAVDGFLDALFEDVLHRPIDSAARSFYAGLLHSGVSSAQVAAAILGSDEYANDLVSSYYLALLERPADPGGLHYFANLLEHGGGDGQVIATLAASDEYFAKTAE